MSEPQPDLDEADVDESPDAAIAALIDLRRTRQRKRMGNLEWFEAAYRVYLVALFGGGGVLWISSAIGDKPAGAATVADIARHGPAVLGIAAALALLAGIRGGAQGGPMALEGPDVMFVMLSPVDRRRALLRPATQRLRSAVYAGVAFGAIAGQLAGRRLPGSPLAWAGGGALFGATVAMIWVGAALVAHAAHLRLWLATAIGIAVLAWQSAAAIWHIGAGPADTVGSLALWGQRQHPIDLVAPAVAIALVVVGIVLLQRTSLDALARRSSLVAQLRFAVTMQDLRTVILLRRQLNTEQARQRPWIQLRRGQRGHAVWRRGWHSMLRLPAPRLVRMSVLAAAAGVTQALVLRGTSPLLLASAVLLFILGLEVMEPLSQEVDQPDRTESLPVERGELMVKHLAAPAVALLPFAIVAAIAAVIVDGRQGAIGVAAILAFPTMLAGAAGSVISIVRDAPDPFSGSNQQAFLPPEMAGFTTALRMIIPVAISALGASTILLVRKALQNGDSPIGAAVRGAIGGLLIAGATAGWVKVRDRLRKQFRAFMAEGRAQTQAARQGTTR